MRVLAITGNTSLVVALGSYMRDWEVVTVGSPEEAKKSDESVVALIDLGDSEQGMKAVDQLYESGITIPCVVVGDQHIDHPNASMLLRPFSLEDLTAVVQEAAQREVTPVGVPRHVAPVEPAPVVPERTPAGKQRPLSVVRPVAPEPAPEAVEPEVEAPTPDAEEAQPVVEEPVDVSVPEEPRYEAPPELAPFQPAPRPTAPPSRPAPARPAAAAQTAAATAETAEPAGRWRLRRKPSRPVETQEQTESPLARRLRAAAAQLRDVRELIDELPVLDDLRALADALVGEMEAQFAGPVASVFTRMDDGFHVIAHRGLSRVEAGMVVLETQPLFSDVLSTKEGILIQPVDLAQGLVAGIGGARTEALMAAPATLGDDVAAIVVVGGDRFDESDLDRLTDLASEAAPGLAVAHLLQKLRGLE